MKNKVNFSERKRGGAMGKIIIIIVTIAIIGVVFIVKNTTPPTEPVVGTEQNKVAATIFPIYDITRTIAGDEFEVVLLLPPGASPHTFDPQPSVLKDLTNSKALFAIGNNLDDWSHDLADALGIPIVIVDDNIELRPTKNFKDSEHGHHHNHDHKDTHGHKDGQHSDDHKEHSEEKSHKHDHDHGPIDPHYWLSLTNAKKITNTIARELSILDSENASIYLQRAVEHNSQLQILREEAIYKISKLDNKNIISSHGAWEYFAYDLGLHIVGSFKSGNAQNPTPRYLAELAAKTEKYNVSTLFIAEQFSSDAIIAFTQDHNLGIANIDPLGGIAGRQSYIELMRHNVNQVVNALKR